VESLKIVCQKTGSNAFSTLRTLMRTHGGPLKALLSLYHGEKPPAIRKHLHKEVNSSSHSLGCVYFSACTYLQRSSLAQPHCAGVGTTVFVSMALGAVYLGVFQAAIHPSHKWPSRTNTLVPAHPTDSNKVRLRTEGVGETRMQPFSRHW
jgi:hypothetical protein